MRFVRFLSDAELPTAEELLAAVRVVSAKDFARGIASREVFWINVWKAGGDAQDGASALPGALLKRVRHLGNDLLVEIFPGHHIVSMGVTVNPPGSSPQEAHLDYGSGFGGIFVPLTELRFESTIATYEPSPQNPGETDGNRLTEGIAESALLAGQGWMQRTLSASRPFAVWALEIDKLHAAVANSTDAPRVMLYVVVSRELWTLAEGAAVLTADEMGGAESDTEGDPGIGCSDP